MENDFSEKIFHVKIFLRGRGPDPHGPFPGYALGPLR